MLDKQAKQEIMEKFAMHEGDTGSPEVQIALLTARISYLTEHLKQHKKYFTVRAGLKDFGAKFTEHFREAVIMDDVEKILQAIQSQRWFFFRNNDKILFDRDTALIWANLDYFPYCEGNSSAYFYGNSYQAVGKLIKEINSNKWGNFSDWRVPKAGELWKIASDKTFPFRSSDYFYIKDCKYWCVDWNNGSYAAKDLAKCHSVQ